MTLLSRCAAPAIVAIVAAIDGALLGGIAAVITSLGGILAIALSYQHGKASAVAPAADSEDDELERLRVDLQLAQAEARALRAERDAAEAKLAARGV